MEGTLSDTEHRKSPSWSWALTSIVISFLLEPADGAVAKQQIRMKA